MGVDFFPKIEKLERNDYNKTFVFKSYILLINQNTILIFNIYKMQSCTVYLNDIRDKH